MPLFLLVIALAAAFRLPELGKRPMHGDEANQAVKTGKLFDNGFYRYDPHEHHGPTLYYLTLPSLWISGAKDFQDSGERAYRVVPALSGVALVALSLALLPGLGAGPALLGSVFVAISHGLVFYSRYYVQEMLFAFFSLSFVAAAYAYARKPNAYYALLAGSALGLAQATKETWILFFAAACAALVCTFLTSRPHRPLLKHPGSVLSPKHALMGLGAAAGISILLYSSFFTNPRGPWDAWATYLPYFHRAGGEGSTALHDKPWYYYLHLLLYTYRSAGPKWSEALIVVLAIPGAIHSLLRRVPPEGNGQKTQQMLFQRYLAFLTLFLVAGFSLIPYKTPWNLIIFLAPMCLLAGIGATALLRWARFWPLQLCVFALLLGFTLQLAHQTYLGNFHYAADVRNPYVYAHTSTALPRLAQRIDDLSKIDPAGNEMRIDIVAPGGDYWPLPWYLRAYDHVGYWTSIPAKPGAPVIIAKMELAEALAAKLGGEYQPEIYSLRPGVLLQVYIEKSLWNRFLDTRR